MKKTFRMILIALSLGLIMVGGLSAGGDAEDVAGGESKNAIVAMVTNQSGLGDQSYNDTTYAGLVQAKAEYGVEVKVVESREQAQYVPNLTALAEEKCDLVIGVGFMIKDALSETAEMFPDVKFGVVDAIVDKANVVSLVFHEQEAAFLVGLIAGKMTKTNIVGFIGGMSTPITNKFEVGYRAGVLTANHDAKVLVSYAGTFADPAKGEEFATPQYAQGADIVFAAAGMTGLGAINAAKKLDKYAIGVDIDQNYLAPDNVISSAMKRVDVATYNAVKSVIDGTFTGGVRRYGIRDGGVDYAPSTSKNVPQEIIDYVDSIKVRIIEGEITPPSTYEEFEAFVPPVR